MAVETDSRGPGVVGQTGLVVGAVATKDVATTTTVVLWKVVEVRRFEMTGWIKRRLSKFLFSFFGVFSILFFIHNT